VPGAFVAAAVFALHPVQVESVAWITERKNVLSGMLYLSSLLLYLRFVGLDDAERSHARRWGSYAGALLLYVGALLSKTVTCSLPAAIVCLLWWKRVKLSRAVIVSLAPMFALGLVLGLTTAWLERENVGARGVTWELSGAARFIIAGRALWFYAGKLLWPLHLSFNYERWDIHDVGGGHFLYPCSAILLLVGLWAVRQRTGRGPLVAVLLFGGTLLPALGFVDLYPMRYSFVADHFQYLASIPITTLVVTAIAVGLTRILGATFPSWDPNSIWSRVPHACCSLAVLGALALLTWRQAGVFQNKETLWNHTLVENPKSWIAHNNLGVYLEAVGRQDESFQHYVAALELNPDFELAHRNLGVLLMRRGRLQEAQTHLEKVIELAPKYGAGYEKLGICYAQQGKTNDAIALLDRALTLTPNDAAIYNNLGWTLASAHRTEEAIRAYRKSLDLEPSDANTHFNMGTALMDLGRFAEAISSFGDAVRLKPDHRDAYYNMGHAYVLQGKRMEAVKCFQTAIRIDRQFTPAKQALQMLDANP